MFASLKFNTLHTWNYLFSSSRTNHSENELIYHPNWYVGRSSSGNINPASYHLTALQLINQLLYINFLSLAHKIFLKDLKSTFPSSVASWFRNLNNLSQEAGIYIVPVWWPKRDTEFTSSRVHEFMSSRVHEDRAGTHEFMSSWVHEVMASRVHEFISSCVHDEFTTSSRIQSSWVYEFMSSWVHEFMSSCVHVFMSSWVHEFMSSWVHEFMSSWVHEFMSSWVDELMSWWVHEFMSSWVHEFMSWWVDEFMSSWVYEFMRTGHGLMNS